MKLRLAVAAWIIGILFPLAWFSRMNPAANSLFNTIFASNWTHIAMHSMLYFVLVIGLSVLWSGRPERIHWKILWIILLVGTTQEALQVIPYRVLPTLDSAFDLLVDLSGATIGLVLYAWTQRRRKTIYPI
ncbi:MAG: hypothetical protein P4L50_29415 [Anaerolineaceae bacterium]|nr:hypothetical protein [Anaerolineaceae bacterium]